MLKDDIRTMGKYGLIEMFGLRKIREDTYLDMLKVYVGDDFKEIMVLENKIDDYIFRMSYLLCSIDNSIAYGNRFCIIIIAEDGIYMAIFKRLPINWGCGR